MDEKVVEDGTRCLLTVGKGIWMDLNGSKSYEEITHFIERKERERRGRK